jgi:hypothetical protein
MSPRHRLARLSQHPVSSTFGPPFTVKRQGRQRPGIAAPCLPSPAGRPPPESRRSRRGNRQPGWTLFGRLQSQGRTICGTPLFDFKGEPCPGACYVEQNVLHSHVGGALGHLMAFSGAISASFWSDQHGNAPYGASDRFVQSQNAAEATAGFWLGGMISGRFTYTSPHLGHSRGPIQIWCRRSSRTINPANCCLTITLKGAREHRDTLCRRDCVWRQPLEMILTGTPLFKG